MDSAFPMQSFLVQGDSCFDSCFCAVKMGPVLGERSLCQKISERLKEHMGRFGDSVNDWCFLKWVWPQEKRTWAKCK